MEVGGVTSAQAVQQSQTRRAVTTFQPVSSAYEPDTDRMTLSQEAQERRQVQEELAIRKKRRDMRREVLRSLLEPGDNGIIPANSIGKCSQIAQRVMRGDRVPETDEKYLMENAPGLYRQSIMMRQAGEEPEEQESLLDEVDLAENDLATAVAVIRPDLERIFKSIWADEDSDPYALELELE